MNDPTLKRTTVHIRYTASDGYRSEFSADVAPGSKNLKTGEPVPPQMALLIGLRELARLTALFGFQDDALREFNEARSAVSEWRATREGGAA